ncbi:enoyl-CoA hydratase/isomerase family protein [Acrocarpospora catenulata]|uniref:enoyl-CoA hydratase/isomerase family protein n=1 Tax=Acrocarpospora catenulata TaxID=2836182 RepID=UPI001BD93E29|nr:enoyl-CoA hydratase/isomerase family protein [Acrocarpospora catenulata]
MTSPVLAEDRGDHLRVTLNRPHVRNAVNLEVVEALHQVCADLERAPRVLVLGGRDGIFAAGADIAELRERRRDDALQGINSGLFDRIARLPMPTVAVVDGPAIGGGAELAYACDLRIGTPRARFGNPEVSLGIIAAAGACWRLAELVGEPMAKEMLLAGRMLSAQEALDCRLITRLVAEEGLVDAVEALVRQLGRADPLALRLTKAAVHSPRAAHPMVDNALQAILFETESKHQRMTAFLEKKERST